MVHIVCLVMEHNHLHVEHTLVIKKALIGATKNIEYSNTTTIRSIYNHQSLRNFKKRNKVTFCRRQSTHKHTRRRHRREDTHGYSKKSLSSTWVKYPHQEWPSKPQRRDDESGGACSCLLVGWDINVTAVHPIGISFQSTFNHFTSGHQMVTKRLPNTSTKTKTRMAQKPQTHINATGKTDDGVCVDHSTSVMAV